ncbi:PorT family protein [Winogradskyella litoriviva]|uniref:PorT family protein n=1 Tax=Winogradskyella litoriviva TaxID=1220182 RepID=A0ABX2E5V7_9FLAO|nr:porin family protein [Winogradskyella litoriviva]NRD23793.1 PorT family protein [Winogradskyella litoriviva]
MLKELIMRASLFLFMIMLFTNYVRAQDQKTNAFSIGINAGSNNNHLRGDSFAEKYDAQYNYFIGLSFEYSINENFSVLTNFNYENRSYKSEYESFNLVWTNTFTVEDKTKIKNLNIPLLLKYKFGFEKEFFINGGLFYNHIFDVSNEMINKETGEDVSDLDFNELFKDKEYGFSLGIGMTFKLNEKNNLALEIRGDYGISDIGDTKFGGISQTKTNTIKFIANWNLNL